MIRRFSTKRIAFFFLLDWLGSLALLLVAARARPELGKVPAGLAGLLNTLHIILGGMEPQAMLSPELRLNPGVLVLTALIWPFFFAVFAIYDGRRNATLVAELRHVFLAICTSTLTLAGALYLTYRETSRVLVLFFFGLDVWLLLGARLAYWAYRKVSHGRGAAGQHGVLIVGAGAAGQRAATRLAEYGWTGISLIGYLDDDPALQGSFVGDLPVLGTLEGAATAVQTHWVRDAVVALPGEAHQRLGQIIHTLQGLGVSVHVVPDLLDLSFPNAALDHFGGIPIVDLGQPGAYAQRWVTRRVFDFLISGLLLVVLAPVYGLLALAIKIDSPGPVIFRQERVGRHGKLFPFLKFRSMRAGSDSRNHQEHMARVIRDNLDPSELGVAGQGSLKLENDPRITRLGRVIRKLSLDELPQLVNVLRGEMSLVGPRPALPYEVDMYQEWHKRRLEALPGVTGWWQVRGRNRVSFDEMVRMDIYYMDHSSLWLDIKILLMTPMAALSGKGAG